MAVQAIGNTRALRQFKDTAVKDDSPADIAAAQRNDPAPPAVAHEVVCSPRPRSPAGIHVVWKFLAPIVTVPIFDAGETRPNRVYRVLQIRPIKPELSWQECGAATGID